jgi:hypothetical protein
MSDTVWKAIEILRQEGIRSFANNSVSFAKWKAVDGVTQIQKRAFSPTDITIDNIKTHNRRDIDYRIDFLNEVDDGTNYPETLYYHFISDPERWAQEPAEERCETFVDLAEDIRQNGIQTPITVGRYYSSTLDAKVEFDGEKEYININNHTGYQLIDGAHRVAAASYLGWCTIPTCIIIPVSFEVPEYTEFIEKRESRYKELIAEESDS